MTAVYRTLLGSVKQQALDPYSRSSAQMWQDFLAIPETPIYTVFRRVHFESQLLCNWLVQVRFSAYGAAGTRKRPPFA